MNTANANIPEVDNNETDASPSSTEAWPFNTQAPVERKNALSPGHAMPYGETQVAKEPTLEEVRAAAIARVGELLDTNPLTKEELAQFGASDALQDWAESLTNLKLALGDLEDAIPTKNRARVVDAIQRLKHNQRELSRFLRLRGLDV